MKFLITIYICLLSLSMFGQRKPNEFVEETNPSNSNFEFYSQKGGNSRRASFDNVKRGMLPNVQVTPIVYVPVVVGNVSNRGDFVKDPNGDIWFIDGAGDGIKMASTVTELDPTVSAYTKTLTSASVLLTQLLSVDGAASALDADLLDGQTGSFYQNAANLVSGTLPLARLPIGTANQILRTNAGATAAEWFTPTFISANQTITLSGDATGSGTTAIAMTIASGAVNSAKILDGTVTFSDWAQNGATNGQVPQWNGSAWVAATPSGSGTVSGTGTGNTLAKWTAGSVVGNSNITDNGTTVTVSTQMEVAGGVYIGTRGASQALAFGTNTMPSVTGTGNNVFGFHAGAALTTGINNTFFGTFSGLGVTSQNENVAIGSLTGSYGSSNTVIGHASGRFSTSFTALTAMSNSVLIGFSGRPGADGATNVTTIGYDVTGAGSNTVTIGNVNVVDNYIRGNINVASTRNIRNQDGTASLPAYTFANDLNTGFYRPASDILAVTVNGTEDARFSDGQFSTVPGTQTAPSYSFTGDLNNGWWSPSGDVQAWSTGGIERMRLTTSFTTSNLANFDITASTQWSMFVGAQGLFGVPTAITALTGALVVGNPLAAGLPAAQLRMFEDNDNPTPQYISIETPTITSNFSQTLTPASGEIGAWLRGSATIDFPSTGVNSQSESNITVTGAAVGDAVIVGIPVNTQGVFTAYVSATNTVTVRYTNTAAVSLDPPSGSFSVHVKK